MRVENYKKALDCQLMLFGILLVIGIISAIMTNPVVMPKVHNVNLYKTNTTVLESNEIKVGDKYYIDVTVRHKDGTVSEILDSSILSKSYKTGDRCEIYYNKELGIEALEVGTFMDEWAEYDRSSNVLGKEWKVLVASISIVTVALVLMYGSAVNKKDDTYVKKVRNCNIALLVIFLLVSGWVMYYADYSVKEITKAREKNIEQIKGEITKVESIKARDGGYIVNLDVRVSNEEEDSLFSIREERLALSTKDKDVYEVGMELEMYKYGSSTSLTKESLMDIECDTSTMRGFIVLEVIMTAICLNLIFDSKGKYVNKLKTQWNKAR